jgi:hypothetical protein
MPFLLPSNYLLTPSRYIYFTVLLASISILLAYRRVQFWKSNILQTTSTQPTTMMSSSSVPKTPARTPVYFLSIGGPNFMEDTKHPAYAQMAAVGREITTKVKPKAIVVFSAH